MAAYRLYLHSKRQGIVGRQDMEASDDAAALWIGSRICDACSDMCDEFEVWAGARRLHPKSRPPTAVDIRDGSHKRLVEVEERLQRSEWAIAHSRRLLARLAEVPASPDESAAGATLSRYRDD
ncbi:MAG: hypothetical protein ACREFQ_17580 [Stellaceae bacterium]